MAAVGSCRAPTEVTLEITTDQPCGVLDGITIAAGSPGAVQSAAAPAEGHSCQPTPEGGTFGTLVLTPSGAKDERFAVEIVGSIGLPVRSCPGNAGTLPAGKGCIVARRSLSFLPHTPLYMPIVLRGSCLNVSCSVDDTCVKGQCVPATVSEPAACATPGACGEGALGEGSDAGVDAQADAGAPDATKDTGVCLRGPAPSSCHGGTPGATCSFPSSGVVGPCPAVCCVTANSAECQSICSTGPATYSFECDEPEDCANGAYCVANAVAGPDAGARCLPPSLACTGARICKNDCDCDAEETCRTTVCPATLGVWNVTAQMSTCGGVCP
jgi:hypothetical protein